jgi:hypothetical protein
MFNKTLVLFWYLVGNYVSEHDWNSWSNWGGVNQGSNGDRIIFKHCKRNINSRQHNDLNK